jgi:hypothetical protein
MKIWVDDIRPAPEGWVWFESSDAVIHFLKFCKRQMLTVHEMSLDHDLGGEDTTRYVVLWMREADFWPEQVYVHSANYVGVEWLEGMIERYHPNNAHKYR